ncbi:Exosome complex exonuclease RRP44 [Zancudomyces culisetae]|uniref:Ribosomal RNA-processing protein 44 n=1 Tax=Zancudomyces culisetae TaxID=1213189 RepID=A0A1R1PWH7_ZANCU|nr:Exosome complex exonuclease RRP44 [Zancudomyces culisetae]|eukprot:OMH85318.1 Exosome complex exonuclease RRP44 [Zancudomyces culisetae]
MLRSKSFVKKTKKGKVVRVVKEHYLRDDIQCGYEGCKDPNCISAREEFLGNSGSSQGLVIAAPLINIHKTGQTVKNTTKKTQILIPDTNEFVKQINVFERPVLNNVVVLQTVLEELKGLNMAIYGRVRRITTEHSRHWYVFSNEHSRDTYIDRNAGESANDRNDRAIRTACLWYQQHVPSDVEIVLITEDKENARLAREAGIEKVYKLEEYLTQSICGEDGGEPEKVKEQKDRLSELLDVMRYDEATDGSQHMTFEGYKPYLTDLQIQEGIKQNIFVQGVLAVSGYNSTEGHIFSKIPGVGKGSEINGFQKEGEQEETERKILIVGRNNMNRAIQGDRVAVKILPESEWRKGPGKASIDEEDDNDDDDGNSDGKDDTAGEKESNKDGGDEGGEVKSKNKRAKFTTENLQVTGVVVGIIKRNWRSYCCFLDPRETSGVSNNKNADSSSGGRIRYVYMIPMDRRIPKIRIKTRQLEHIANKKVVVSIDEWTTKTKYPVGHYVRSIGDAGDKETETEVVLLEHEINYSDFSEAVKNDMKPFESDPEYIPNHIKHVQERLQNQTQSQLVGGSLLSNGDIKRKDLRYLDVCSIDPPGCTDIDDALHCKKLPNGNYSVGVHIADVTHFVRPNTAVDKEASNRCTTVYLVDRRIDMLPSVLGTNLCSLRSKVDRLAFSVLWELDSNANVVAEEFCKSIVSSRESFTYDEAQARIDDTVNYAQDPITDSLRQLNALAKQLRARRMSNGALELMSPQIKFKMMDDQAHSDDPQDIYIKPNVETNSLVEEFMLLANIRVARKIYTSFPEFALLRRHPEPPLENFAVLQRALNALYNLEFDASSSKSLSASLKAVDDGEYLNSLVRILTTRCMLQALYFCSGSVPDYKEFRHYGLATDIYTHFTSPIRRYADVLVHRLLESAIYGHKGDSSDYIFNKHDIDQQCDTINRRHKAAQTAGRSSIELFTNLFFKAQNKSNNTNNIQYGYITQILQNGFSVFIPNYGIEGFVVIQSSHSTNNNSNSNSNNNNNNNKNDNNTDLDVQAIENYSLVFKSNANATINLFQKVKVLLKIDEISQHNISSMRRKLNLYLIEPVIAGLSVEIDTKKAQPTANQEDTDAIVLTQIAENAVSSL